MNMIERHFLNLEVQKSEQLKPKVIHALESLKQDGVVEATVSQIKEKIHKIHPPKHIFDRVDKKGLDLSLEILEEDEEIEAVQASTIKGRLKSIPMTLYRRINPEQQTTTE